MAFKTKFNQMTDRELHIKLKPAEKNVFNNYSSMNLNWTKYFPGKAFELLAALRIQ